MKRNDISEKLLTFRPEVLPYYRKRIELLNAIGHPLSLLFWDDIASYPFEIYYINIFDSYKPKKIYFKEKDVIYNMGRYTDFKEFVMNNLDIYILLDFDGYDKTFSLYYNKPFYPSNLAYMSIISPKSFSTDDASILLNCANKDLANSGVVR